MKIKPLGNRIVVKPFSAEQTLKSGIVIPDTAKEKPQEGEVVAVGPGELKDGKRLEMEVKKGDQVIFENWAGKEYKVDGIEYKILREEEILGLIEK
jgi:chaperonin GroES